jgi:L-fucose mutarotase
MHPKEHSAAIVPLFFLTASATIRFFVEERKRRDAMLKGISPVLSPVLLKVLAEMGHGDEILLADAHFPGNTYGKRVLRADGVEIPALLDGILPLFELDAYVDAPLIMMQAVPGDQLDPSVEEAFLEVAARHTTTLPNVERVERFAFYDRAQQCYAVVMTGSTMKYGNIILKKGVTPLTGTPA